MRRLPALLAAAVLGLVCGATLVLAIQDAPASPSAPLLDGAPAAPATALPTVTVPTEPLLLVWTPGGLPPVFADAVTRLPMVDATTIVWADPVHMVRSSDAEGTIVDDAGGGRVFPLDAFAVDPRTYRAFVPTSVAATLDALAPGDAVLGETSAALRRLGPGGSIELAGGQRLTVAAVVPDVVVGGAEIVVALRDAASVDIATPRFLLLTYSGDRASAQAAIGDVLPAGERVRFRGPGESAFLRHGDAVLPQAFMKARFGEFAYTPPTSGREFVPDPAWVAANIVTAQVPVLGEVRCHRSFVPALTGALAELESRNLGYLIDPRSFGGCFNPRFISTDPRSGISHHAWGAAVDLNTEKNQFGGASHQDTRLIDVMARWGMGWGGDWLVPDPMHFEYLRPPQEVSEK